MYAVFMVKYALQAVSNLFFIQRRFLMLDSTLCFSFERDNDISERVLSLSSLSPLIAMLRVLGLTIR